MRIFLGRYRPYLPDALLPAEAPAWAPGGSPGSSANPLRRAPVTIGQDNEYVYREVVGMDEAEYASHVASGQIGDTYSSDVLP